MAFRIFFSLFLCVLGFSQAVGQSISPMLLSPWGLSAQSASYQLDASVGELAVRTFTQSGQTLNQGFHQYYENVLPTSTHHELPARITLRLYPNPTDGALHLELGEEQAHILIYSLDGRLRWSGSKPAGTTQVTAMLHDLQAGWYTVQVVSDGRIPQTLPFIKH